MVIKVPAGARIMPTAGSEARWPAVTSAEPARAPPPMPTWNDNVESRGGVGGIGCDARHCGLEADRQGGEGCAPDGDGGERGGHQTLGREPERREGHCRSRGAGAGRCRHCTQPIARIAGIDLDEASYHSQPE